MTQVRTPSRSNELYQTQTPADRVHFTHVKLLLSHRSFHVCHPIQHGPHWQSFVQGRRAADGLQLRGAVYENHGQGVAQDLEHTRY